MAGNTTFNICLSENTCTIVSTQCMDNGAGISCPIYLCTNNIECQNGGLCINNACFCPNNYYGVNCELDGSNSNIPTVTPTGLFGLKVGYPLYLSLAIPSAFVSAFIVCHLCLICCIPAMLMCRRGGRKLSQKNNNGFRSSHMIENETRSAAPQVHLHAVPSLENRHTSMLHEYTEMNIQFSNLPQINSFQIPHSTDRPLPPPPPARAPAMNPPPRLPNILERESGQYSYPTVRNFNVISNGPAIPRSDEFTASRESGYTKMEPKYVIQNHGDRASYGGVNV